MSKKEAIELAIKALGYQATEIYEGEEYDEPDIQTFVNKQNEAIKILLTL